VALIRRVAACAPRDQVIWGYGLVLRCSTPCGRFRGDNGLRRPRAGVLISRFTALLGWWLLKERLLVKLAAVVMSLGGARWWLTPFG
jgi:hypothetical protein